MAARAVALDFTASFSKFNDSLNDVTFDFDEGDVCGHNLPISSFISKELQHQIFVHRTDRNMGSSVFRKGATAVISGSAGGVGFAFARICRQHGMNLALLDRDTDNLTAAKSILESPDTQTESYTIDVSSIASWNDVAKDISTTFPSVDLLMLNAGHGPKPSTTSAWLDIEYFHNTLNTNLFGVINGINTFLPHVQKSKGPSAIVLTGSKTRHHQSPRKPSLQRLQISRQDPRRTPLPRPPHIL